MPRVNKADRMERFYQFLEECAPTVDIAHRVIAMEAVDVPPGADPRDVLAYAVTSLGLILPAATNKELRILLERVAIRVVPMGAIPKIIAEALKDRVVERMPRIGTKRWSVPLR